MADGIDEALHDRINRKLRGHALINSSSRRIFKVPNTLREINEKAYEPRVISIGPYHHGKEHLKAMEVHKMNSLKLFLDRTKESSVERYVTALEEMEEKIRGFYSKNLDHIGGDELVEMMLLDGFFIIGLIFYGTNALTDFYWRNVLRDLLLVENQLPFSVLSKLHSLFVDQMGPLKKDANDIILEDVISYFRRMVPGLPIIPRPWEQEKMKSHPPIIKCPENQDDLHMLGLLHYNVTRTPQGPPNSTTASFPWWLPRLAWARRPPQVEPDVPCSASIPAEISEPRKWRFIRSATELNEAGIKFQKKEGELFDIEFHKGVMSIPTLTIDDDTESIFRNFVAYEQCYMGISSKPFTDYITFMDCLINTGKDVGLLCSCVVLDNWLGDHEVVASMFNRLRNSVLISGADFWYFEIFTRVDEHCNRKWNSWKANLWHNYFNTPWASISFIAAVILLLSTLLQTLFSIFSYHH